MVAPVPETTPHTAAEAFAVVSCLPDPGVAQQKVIDLLAAQLNAEITYANAALTSGGQTTMRPVAPQVLPAPAKITDHFVNHALVDVSGEFEVRGSGLIDFNGVLSVFIVDGKLEGPTSIAPAWRRAMCVVGVLEKYLGGYYDAQGNKLWHALRPWRMAILPEAFAGYSGVAIHYRLEQKSAVKQDGTGAGSFWPAHP
jgi:hypothetical protein